MYLDNNDLNKFKPKQEKKENVKICDLEDS